MKLIVPAPAKVNLSLWINGKRPDGYHELVTVLHTVNLFDTLTFMPSDRFELQVEGDQLLPLGRSNLIVKAAELFRRATGIKPNVKIKLLKKIPIGAGLGGGSSNAAAALKALNTLYGKPLSEPELHQLAAQIGSDVPFFIRGGLAVATGRGEKLKHYNPAHFKLLLVYPDFSCPTAEVYKSLPPINREMGVEDAEKLIISPLIVGNLREVAENAHNDLEESKHPCVERVKREVKPVLEEVGVKPIMSGSGSCVFGLVEDEKEIDLSPLKKSGWWYKLLTAI
ncbi:4-(cytidine 5'-diphospho)-2-C-methyl-D-erythritol kinase [Thermovibrio ammonificans]|jgi:4-diphosphocytidyl-2-C-methyl-D-erythritol kinase|uniref:4-diphosphocytidyl-2-C-methyl-D-erythritol kinase n=1 Tax=Thermovibrio ammonificans (strain DSM 15698 / JCM 12110 / HB-1) TaxID=648996 RepID=E8T5E0_THEA1|nr:4-(cytidine 5'-diphospho)-2-C-methyl-D-erythritol kinase [Thermovibrio ammonificans]ADU97594.1 4-diphosphocytidyl-2C-methyl-D-erythritol kinase [Thermovibrio ammonificans HB-1]